MAKYKENKNSLFINPYNFICNSEIKTERKTDNSSIKTHTGYINCKIEVKTPMAIPDTEKKNKQGNHFTYPFMNVNGRYIIPGSSIRGAIRSVFETVTDSCMGTLQPKTTISTRIRNLDAFRPGLLQYDGKKWRLFPAERYAIVMKSKGYKYYRLDDREKFEIKYVNDGDTKEKRIIINGTESVRYGDKVCFIKGNDHKEKNGDPVWEYNVKHILKDDSNNMGEIGYVYIGETFAPKKHAESIFVKKEPSEEDKYSEDKINDAIYGLEQSLKVYQDEAINRNLGKGHTGYRGFESAKERIEKGGGMLPIWYKCEEGKLFFSLAAIGRKQYRRTINEMAGEHCKSKEMLCQACSLFGMIPPKKENDDTELEGKGSRIRFTDAFCDDVKLSSEPITLKELGKPRPSYLPFYAKGGVSYDAEGGNIRGRKYYWHIPEAATEKNIYQSRVKNERNASHFLMMPGATFSFTIFFDRVSSEELKTLIWCLVLGDKDGDNQRYHHIGHGKPLGLGSAKINIERCFERVFTGERYEIKETNPSFVGVVDERKPSVRELLMISEFAAVNGEKVTYPYVEVGTDETVNRIIQERNQEQRSIKENVLASHQWFTQFRGTSKKSLHRILPSIEDVYNRKSGYQMSTYELSCVDEEKDFEKPKEERNTNNHYRENERKRNTNRRI